MGHFYHYSDADKWRQTLQGGSYGREGLLPLRRMVPLGLCGDFARSATAERGAIFGLTEPAPRAWLDNEDFNGPLLENVFSNFGRSVVLLRVKVLPTDDVHIADWGVHLDSAYQKRRRNDRTITARTKRAYVDSLVPFGSDHRHFHVPEVLCFSDIPLHRVQVVNEMQKWQWLNLFNRGTGQPARFPPREPNHALLEDMLGLSGGGKPPRPRSTPG